MNQLGTTTHGVEGETTCVAEHIEHTLTLGVFLKQGTVLALVNEEPGLLTTEPVDIEAQTVLYGDIVIATAQEEAILGFHKGEGGLALIIDILNATLHHLGQSLGNSMTRNVHTNAMGLHHGCLVVDINNQSWE